MHKLLGALLPSVKGQLGSFMSGSAVLLGVTCLGRWELPGGNVHWDTPRPVLAHALREISSLLPCESCQRGTHGVALKSHFIIVNFP